MKPLASLVPLSAALGVLSLALFRRFRSPDLGRTINRILAHIMELHLFLDEPRLVFKAQCDLLRENLRLLRQIALPCLIAAPVFALVMWQGDRIYGRAPLPAGEPVVVTAHGVSGSPQLQAPANVVIESPAVRIPRLKEVSWRIRPARPLSGGLSLVNASGPLEIPWPRAVILGLPWLVWFFGISALSALLAQPLVKRIVPVLLIATAAHAAPTPVILISIDTLRADHLSAYGYTRLRTPGIDGFAEKGTIYTAIDAQVPLTLPSHTSLMTSTYPFQDRVELNGDAVPAGALTLASLLHANGYRTAAFIGSMVLDKRFGLDQGFDVYDSPFGASRVRRDAALVTRAAERWLNQNETQPVFVFVHLYDLHTPYTIPAVASLMPAPSGYDAELEHVDQVLGRFHESLVRSGWWDKALVIVLADHGESLGDHGETSHGYFVYESTMHVPLIVHWPDRGNHPARVERPAGLIDVAPTILEYLHIPPPKSFAGVSLLSGSGETAIYGESIYPRRAFGWAALRSVRDGRYEYIQAPKPELYDLIKDPGERVNLLRADQPEAQLLNSELSKLLTRYPAESLRSVVPMPAQARAELGSLGYTSGSSTGGSSSGKSAADPKDKLAEEEAYENGLAFLYSGRYEKAIVTLGKIVRQDSANLPAFCALEEAERRSGNKLARQGISPDCAGRE